MAGPPFRKEYLISVPTGAGNVNAGGRRKNTTDVFYRFRKRDILKENGLRRNGKGRIRMKRAYFNCILLDGTEQMEPAAHNNAGTGGLPRPRRAQARSQAEQNGGCPA